MGRKKRVELKSKDARLTGHITSPHMSMKKEKEKERISSNPHLIQLGCFTPSGIRVSVIDNGALVPGSREKKKKGPSFSFPGGVWA